MTIYNNLSEEFWADKCRRPYIPTVNLQNTVKHIIERVRTKGDSALLDFAFQFDGATLQQLMVTENEIENATKLVSTTLKDAIGVAINNIRIFHKTQQLDEIKTETTKGVLCWRRQVAIENVGLYIPGGTAPLFSTLIMLAIPAQIAGCERIVLCTPPDKNGIIDPAILYTAGLLGITEIYKAGGAQAIAAMAYGTDTIKKVDKIFGPGNQYVTKAKEIIQQEGIAIDLPAGPSEVLIIADETADADFVAADLLSQAEHGTDSQVVLLTTEANLAEKVQKALKYQLSELPRASIAQKSLENSFCVVLPDIERCFDFSNMYAPEHLILALKNPVDFVNQVVNAGSVFLGHYSCESAGDYASGTNHTLPTNGLSKSYSGVSLDSFVKKITFQHISAEGLQNLGKTIEVMAEAEHLFAHKNAVSIRLKKLSV
ncbi:MAG: histidinol dehydrogenase [Saprospiraceae bacterium]|nr:histidinol dehydrogenase [Saprospiraceae bacterium]